MEFSFIVDCNAVRCKENSRCEIGIYQKKEQEDFCTREQCNLKVWGVARATKAEDENGMKISIRKLL